MRVHMNVSELNPKIKMSFSDKIIMSDGDYEQGYKDGYDKGYKQGESDGYTNGLNDGYADGYNEGYQLGYIQGMQDGNTEGYDRGYAYGYEQGYSEGYAKGFEDGKAQGYTEGETAGYNRGFSEGETSGIEQGKLQERSELWEAIQWGGTRGRYDYVFYGENWTTERFKPKYDITPSTAQSMFYGCRISGDLVEILNSSGVKLDFSRCTNFANTFQNFRDITRIGIVDFSGAVGVASWQIGNTFYQCAKLVTIDKVIVNEDLPNFSQTFNLCYALENVTFEGVIAKNGLLLSHSPNLTHDSLMSVINCLKDYSTDTSGASHTVTLGTTNLAKLTDAEKAIATQKGWTLA